MALELFNEQARRPASSLDGRMLGEIEQISLDDPFNFLSGYQAGVSYAEQRRFGQDPIFWEADLRNVPEAFVTGHVIGKAVRAAQLRVEDGR